MSLQCRVRGHQLDQNAVYNSGFYFTTCGRCRGALMRSPKGEWQTAPNGHRIVWKAGWHSHSLEADYSGVLPVVGDVATLPALRNPFLSWSRFMVPLRAARASSKQLEGEEQVEEYRHPRLLFAAVLVGIGFNILSRLATGR